MSLVEQGEAYEVVPESGILADQNEDDRRTMTGGR